MTSVYCKPTFNGIFTNFERFDYKPPLKISKTKLGFAWNPHPLRNSVQRMFFKFSLLFVLLLFQVICQSQADHDTFCETSKVLTSGINPSIIQQTGQGFIFKCISLHVRKNIFACKNILIFTDFRLLKSAFMKLTCPWHDLIINPSCRTATSHKFGQNCLSTLLS